ncbi:MAG TPA: TfoX/Sxy family protein [Dehalococcoidia bacterium]|nr:TfoX/Sxy family protein [Dehalococcoidia bacterium]
MPVNEGYREYVMERLECVGQVTARSMFGGVGIYFEGLFCALIAEDVLYFKVDDVNRADYEAAGMGPFRSGGQTMQFYEVPADVLEDEGNLRLWAGKALDVAGRRLVERGKKKAKPKKKM